MRALVVFVAGAIACWLATAALAWALLYPIRILAHLIGA